jgi:uncharacterized protein YerC
MHKELFNFLFHLSTSGKARLAFGELFTQTEKLMLAKRLAIVFMLEQKESIYAIEQVLKVSPSTVARMSVKHENGGYEELISEIKKHQSFWFQLSKIIPPRVGRDRFKNFLKF